MNKLVLYEDSEKNEFVVLCTDPDYFDVLVKDCEITEEMDLDFDISNGAWPTNRPLSQDF